MARGKEPGWNAKGLLAPLWRRYPGGRDALAKAVGSTGSALSSRNSGDRPLGHDLGSRLATELNVSIFELGAPQSAVDDQESLTLLDRLAELGAEVAVLLETQATLTTVLDETRTRLEPLERAQQRRAAASKQRPASGP